MKKQIYKQIVVFMIAFFLSIMLSKVNLSVTGEIIENQTIEEIDIIEDINQTNSRLNLTEAPTNEINKSIEDNQLIEKKNIELNLIVLSDTNCWNASANPHPICSCVDLQNISMNSTTLTWSYTLQNNIDCSETITWNSGAGFAPLGTSSSPAFTGTLNGKGYTISGLYINRTQSYVGLFGYTGFGAVIYDLGVINSDIRGIDYIGGIVGQTSSTKINNTYYSGNITVISGYSAGYVGGFAGAFSQSQIWKCYAQGYITGSGWRVGGFVGFTSGSTTQFINRSFSNVKIYTTYNGAVAGGFVGAVNSGFYNDCYARGNVTATSGSAAGFASTNFDGSGDGANNCYGTGLLWGSSSKMGFVSSNSAGITNSFWDINSTNATTSGTGATGKTTLQMKNVSTFTDLSTSGLTTSWDFQSNPNNDTRNEEIWAISSSVNDGYPYLIGVGVFTPVVSQIAPANNYYLSGSSANVTFSCSATAPNGLKNLSFYLTDNFNTQFILNQSNELNGSSGSSIWNLTLLSGNYTWNCFSYDQSNLSSWGSNRTIYFDNEAPFFSSLTNQTIVSGYSFSYQINVTDSGSGVNCFSINDTTNFKINCSSGVLRNNTYLSTGTYGLNITVNDTLGNTASGIIYVNVTPVPIIGLSLISPSGDINVTQNQTFLVSVNISCTGANCGAINVTLDPETNTIYNFTTCGATGTTGPTFANCNSTYNGKTLQGLVGVTNGIQNWTVPTTGTYTIEAAGAKGGCNNGGNGAKMTGTFTLTAGTVLQILVGQSGLCVSYGGGGGGTFVASGTSYGTATPLIIVGGGGGDSSSSSAGRGGVDTINGTDGVGVTGNKGTNGFGGGKGTGSYPGAGGGGYYGNGTSGSYGVRGLAFISGGTGGTSTYNGAGGFGGGGGNGYYGGGGGGGYSGGGGGYSDDNAGGGGGSYNSGINQNNTNATNSGGGYVSITHIGGGKSGTISMNTSATPFYTTTQNPYNISLNAGQSQIITWTVNATGNTNTTYSFFVYANLTSIPTISNITPNWNVTIVNFSVGPSAPSVNIVYPTMSNYTASVTRINYTVSADPTLIITRCWYSTDGGATNSTKVSAGVNFTNLTSTEGSNTWKVYCDDNNSMIGTGSVTFAVDSIPPSVSISSPNNNSEHLTQNLAINYTVADSGLGISSCWYSNDTININTTLTGCANITNITWSFGQHNVTIWANDSAGNRNSSKVTFTISRSYPLIEFISPTLSSGSFTNLTSFEANLSVSEADLNSLIYNWNGTNYTSYDNSLVLMYNFDGLSALGENSTYVVDNSKRGNNGTVNGSVWTSSGKYGGAYQFDGVNDYISAGDKPEFVFEKSSNFTISLWYNAKEASKWYHLLSTETAGTVWQGWGLGTRADNNTMMFAMTNNYGTSNHQWITSTSNYPVNTWTHVVIAYNGTNAAGIVMYWNGIKQSVTIQANSLSGSTDSNLALSIGRRPGQGLYLNGSIDEVRMWNRTLSPSEVYQQYLSNLQKFNQTQWYLYVNQSKNATAGLDYGTYTYQAFATDTSDSSSSTEQRTITVSNITAPVVTISSPSNNVYSSDSGLDVTYSLVYSTLSSCWYSDNNEANTPLLGCANLTSAVWSEGNHTVTIYANDTSGRIGSSSITFIIDLTNPTIDISYPENNTNSNNNGLDILYVAFDTNRNSCWYNDNSGSNTTLTNCANITSVTWSESNHNVTVYVNDGASHNANARVSFNIDSTNPAINITSPSNNINTTDNGLDVIYSVSDNNLGSCWYNDNGGSNSTLAGCSNITTMTWGEGNHTVTIYANDTFGNLNSINIFFSIDSFTPTINITSPNSNLKTSNTNLNITYLASDDHLDRCWYSNDSMSSNITLVGCANVTTITWGEGNHNVTIWANDTYSNIGNDSVSFTIDTISPSISIISPQNNTNTTDESLDILYSVGDDNLDFCWYSNDMMSINTTLIGCDNITSVVWSVGEHNVIIWTNDSAKNQNSSSIAFTILLDLDDDGITDTSDPLLYNESNVTRIGITLLNITVGGNRTNESYNGTQEVVFYDSSTKIINFTFNFSASTLDLSKVTITKAANSIIVNLSGQLQVDYNKTLYIEDNDFISLCVKDAEVSSIDEISPGCNSESETDFTACLGNNRGITVNSTTCIDTGSIIELINLKHSAVRGTPASSSSSSSSGGGSSSLSSSSGSGGSSSVECIKDSDCESEKYCWEYKCVKIFDVKILESSSFVQPGEELFFKYLVKGMADISGDVVINFWAENNGEIISSGSDTIYLGSFEEKNESTKILIPSNAPLGIYKFYVEVSYGDYKALAYRTVQIDPEANLEINILENINLKLGEPLNISILLKNNKEEIFPVILKEKLYRDDTIVWKKEREFLLNHSIILKEELGVFPEGKYRLELSGNYKNQSTYFVQEFKIGESFVKVWIYVTIGIVLLMFLGLIIYFRMRRQKNRDTFFRCFDPKDRESFKRGKVIMRENNPKPKDYLKHYIRKVKNIAERIISKVKKINKINLPIADKVTNNFQFEFNPTSQLREYKSNLENKISFDLPKDEIRKVKIKNKKCGYNNKNRKVLSPIIKNIEKKNKINSKQIKRKS